MDDGLYIEDDPTAEEGTEINERTYQLIGIAGAVVNLAAFTGVGVFALDNAVYGGITGVFVGVGSYLSCRGSWAFRRSRRRPTSGRSPRSAGENPPAGSWA